MSGTRTGLRRERDTLIAMIEMYCKGNHASRGSHASRSVCGDCVELLEYATLRLDNCPFREEKPTCARCSVHCYRKPMRKRIKEVMRYSGPRMLFRHPILALAHILRGLRSPEEVRKRK